jgi:hypothetical protein
VNNNVSTNGVGNVIKIQTQTPMRRKRKKERARGIKKGSDP